VLKNKGSNGFKSLSAIAVPIEIPNCDTDQIIPARFLRQPITDPNYRKVLFHDLRFNQDGSETDFVFNHFSFKNGKIFVSDINWGCGSSRENAVMALKANHICVVIAPSFGDIHYNNCIKNGILPIRLSSVICKILRDQLWQSPGAKIQVNLEKQFLISPNKKMYEFNIDSLDKYRLINNFNDLDLTEEFTKEIINFTEIYGQRHRWASITD